MRAVGLTKRFAVMRRSLRSPAGNTPSLFREGPGDLPNCMASSCRPDTHEESCADLFDNPRHQAEGAKVGQG